MFEGIMSGYTDIPKPRVVVYVPIAIVLVVMGVGLMLDGGWGLITGSALFGLGILYSRGDLQRKILQWTSRFPNFSKQEKQK